ncbi:MAG TPA: oligogalacturonate lyase family protein [Acidobacteriaceae bacterium]|nr:oligogalacturonate lyase family protein [Acidobacteriaceae bacterium]
MNLFRLKTAACAAIVACLVPLAAHAQRPASTVKPDAVGSDPSWKPGQEPPKSWIDPATGHRVLRVTNEPDSASFYFNVNAYTPDGKHMAYTAPDGIYLLDLDTWKSRRVVEGKVRTIQVGFKTPSVFYVKQEGGAEASSTLGSRAPGALYVTNMETGETRKLATLPARGFVSTINADETLAAGTYIEGNAGENTPYTPPARPQTERGAQQAQNLLQPLDKGQMMERRLAAHLPLVLFVIDLRTGKMRTLLHSTDWVNHLLFSPTDPNLLMYCHEGPWQKVDRIWTIRTDGTHNTMVHKRTMFMEIFGHEFWGHDGHTLWYDWQTPKGEDFWLASYNVDTGRRTAYHMQRNEWSIHFNVSRGESLFCGDGGDPGQVAHAPDGEWINLFHPEMIKGQGINKPDFIQPGVFHAERLVKMDRHNYRLEPNVSFTPDMKWIIFRSNMFGPTYVFAVEVAKSGEAGAAAQ